MHVIASPTHLTVPWRGAIVRSAMAWNTYRRIRSECELLALVDFGFGAVSTWRPLFEIDLDGSVPYGWARLWFRGGHELGVRVILPEIRGEKRCQL